MAQVREKPASELMTPETRKAIERGLRYLAGRQLMRGKDRGAFGTSGYSGSVAVCGLAGLAFLSDGSTPGAGRYGKNLDLCVDFITRHTSSSGYIARGSNAVGNMYGHGFATLFLSQAYGMSKNQMTGDKLRAAVGLIVSAQDGSGGWRYQPRPNDADLSVTVCQIMALRGARDAGIHVPDSVRDKCIDYVKKSQNKDGGFRYTRTSGSSGSVALTGAGCVSLYSAGIYEDEALEKGLKYILKGKSKVHSHYFFYTHYYAVQAFWHAGGKRWESWYEGIRDTLLGKQNKSNGAWSSNYSEEYGTAMALIILQMPRDIVPVFAR